MSYAVAVAYLAFIFLGNKWMKTREAWDLKALLAGWNLFLAASRRGGGWAAWGLKGNGKSCFDAGEPSEVFSLIGAARTVPQLLGAWHQYGFSYTVALAHT